MSDRPNAQFFNTATQDRTPNMAWDAKHGCYVEQKPVVSPGPKPPSTISAPWNGLRDR